MNPIAASIEVIAGHVKRSLLRKMRDPMVVQETFLRDLLVRHAGTEMGRALGLAEIKTVEQFRARVPIRTYADFEPMIARIARGETNVLTPDPILYLNVTSGTTGRQKQIPVTRRFRRTLGRAQFAGYGFGIDAHRRHANGCPASERPRFGKWLVGQTTANFGTTEGGIPFGRATSGRLQSVRFLVNGILAHPLETMGLSDASSRHYLSLLFSLCHEDLAFIMVGFPINLLHVCQSLEAYSEPLVADIAAGTISHDISIEPSLRRMLEKRRRPEPQRAAMLQDSLKRDGRLTPKTAWRTLSALVTGMGGPSEFYVQRFPEYFGDIPVFGGNYSASEGAIGIYTEFNTHHCALAIESGFFELIPEDQWDADQPKTVLAADAEIGRQYRVVMSNYNGLMRYDLEDIVEVVDFIEQTPVITFRRRRGGQLSSVLEKTTEHHVNQVVRTLQQDFGPLLQDFCVTLSAHEVPAHYLVNIELAPGRSLDDPRAFLHRFDQDLREVNWLYGMLRTDRIPPPKLRLLAAGSFAELRQRLVARASPNADIKPPHVSEDRQLMSGLAVVHEFDLEGSR